MQEDAEFASPAARAVATMMSLSSVVKTAARASLSRTMRAGHLRRLDVGRALPRGLAHQRFDVGRIALRVGAGTHLDRGSLENCPWSCFLSSSTPLASSPSSRPCRFQLVEVVAAADMHVADENLRKGRAAVGARDHLLAQFRRETRRRAR